MAEKFFIEATVRELSTKNSKKARRVNLDTRGNSRSKKLRYKTWPRP
jgi:hypothetical protein